MLEIQSGVPEIYWRVRRPARLQARAFAPKIGGPSWQRQRNAARLREAKHGCAPSAGGAHEKPGREDRGIPPKTQSLRGDACGSSVLSQTFESGVGASMIHSRDEEEATANRAPAQGARRT